MPLEHRKRRWPCLWNLLAVAVSCACAAAYSYWNRPAPPTAAQTEADAQFARGVLAKIQRYGNENGLAQRPVYDELQKSTYYAELGGIWNVNEFKFGAANAGPGRATSYCWAGIESGEDRVWKFFLNEPEAPQSSPLCLRNPGIGRKPMRRLTASCWPIPRRRSFGLCRWTIFSR